MKFSEVVFQIRALTIDRARAHQKLPTFADEGMFPENEQELIPLSFRRSKSAETQAFLDYCRTLSHAQVCMLVLIMYAGRGNFGDTFDFLDTYTRMSDTFDSTNFAIRKILENGDFLDWLSSGLAVVQNMQINLDDLV